MAAAAALVRAVAGRSPAWPRKRVIVLMKAGTARVGVDLLSYAGAKKSKRLGEQTPRSNVCLCGPWEEGRGKSGHHGFSDKLELMDGTGRGVGHALRRIASRKNPDQAASSVAIRTVLHNTTLMGGKVGRLALIRFTKPQPFRKPILLPNASFVSLPYRTARNALRRHSQSRDLLSDSESSVTPRRLA
ncbi:hypothetical protein L209DRAFT_754877 [Thermothelomyces heterothallicus CBS 203.75]